jgi:hypothetical protein
MAVEINTPVSAIEGIGPAATAALAGVGIYTVFDLLRVRPQALSNAVRDVASADEARSWRRMAILLQVAELTPQWCEALVSNEIGSLDELLRHNIDGIEAVMRRAMEQRSIQTVPTSVQVAEILKDAAVIRYTGSLTGTILDTEGQPVVGAAIRVGSEEAVAGGRGRFRVLRIPLGGRSSLRIVQEGYEPLVVEEPHINRSVEVIHVQTFRLQKLGTSMGSGTLGSAGLSELGGDLLPVPRSMTVRQETIEEGELKPGDIVMVRQFDLSGVLLVCRLKAYEGGEFVIRVLRVSRDRLPSSVKLRDHLRFSGSAFAPIEMGTADLYRYKIRLRMRKAFASRPVPTTPEQKKVHSEEQIAFLLDHGYFTVGRGGPRELRICQ